MVQEEEEKQGQAKEKEQQEPFSTVPGTFMPPGCNMHYKPASQPLPSEVNLLLATFKKFRW